MSPLDFLLQRRSYPILQAPAPSAEQINVLMQAALRAPDHGNLKPFRFVIYDTPKLRQLGAAYVAGMQQSGETDAVKLERAAGLPLRAPMVMVAVARLTEHGKIPKQEQLLTAALATFQIVNAAEAMGFGAYWRTGDIAYNPAIWQALGLAEGEQVIGYVYLGTKAGEAKPVAAAPAPNTFWQYG